MLEEQIYNLLLEMHEETFFKVLEVDKNETISFIKRLLANEGFISIKGLNPVKGIMLAEAYPHFFTHDIIAVDHVIYVTKDARKQGIAKEMVEEYIDWAKAKNAKMIMVGSSTGFDGADKLFESCGLKKIGANYGLW